jgi:hypothetical protein
MPTEQRGSKIELFITIDNIHRPDLIPLVSVQR